MTPTGWYATTTAQLRPYRRFPKVDLHRHLEGSLRLETLLDVARIHGITLPMAPDLRSRVQMHSGDALTFSTFLSKFQMLRLFYRSPEVIARVTREAVADAAEDGVLHLELRFTPVALARVRDFGLGEVMDWVIESAAQAGRDYGISVRLIASVNRNESVALAEKVAGLALERMERGIVGLDLAGNEADFPAAPFAGLFHQVKQAGLSVLAHAGEWAGPANVREAIEVLEVQRVAHGVRVMEDPAVVALARERQVPFEVCITSNYQSGVVASLTEHPLQRMLEAGLYVTLNTDDPSISQITLSEEYRLAVESLGLTQAQLGERILAAARASLLPQSQKQALHDQILTFLRKEN
jgi:adenosine deaminase